MSDSNSYNDKLKKFNNTLRIEVYKLLQRGYEYKCSIEFPRDYFNMKCNLYYSFFGETNEKFESQKRQFEKFSELSYDQVRKYRENGALYLTQPKREEPEGTKVDCGGEMVIIPKWRDIETRGGQFDDSDD